MQYSASSREVFYWKQEKGEFKFIGESTHSSV